MNAADTGLLQAGTYTYDMFVTYRDNTVTMSTRLHRLIYGNLTVQQRTTKSV